MLRLPIAMGRAARLPAIARSYSHAGFKPLQPPSTALSVVVVGGQTAVALERFGKPHKILKPGLHFTIPLVDKAVGQVPLYEVGWTIEPAEATTGDNVRVHVSAVVFIRIVDPFKAVYGIDDYHFAIHQLAQTAMRSVVGNIDLDALFKTRVELNTALVKAINEASVERWGIECLRCEIRDITTPSKISEAMTNQASAERNRRAAVIDSEGQRDAAVNRATAEKQSVILASEADRIKKVNDAEAAKVAAVMASEANRIVQENDASGKATAMLMVAEAQAKAIERMTAAMSAPGGRDAVSADLMRQYITDGLRNLSGAGTVLLPSQMWELPAIAKTVFETLKLKTV